MLILTFNNQYVGYTLTVIPSMPNTLYILQDTGFTALMFACKGGHLDTVITLLEHSANTALRNRVCILFNAYYATLLHSAVECIQLEEFGASTKYVYSFIVGGYDCT